MNGELAVVGWFGKQLKSVSVAAVSVKRFDDDDDDDDDDENRQSIPT